MERAALAFLGLAAASVTLYNLAQRLIPRGLNPFTALLVAYLLAAALCLGVILASPASLGWTELRRHLHPSVLALALAILGIEVGYLLAYRAGLRLAIGPMTATVAATVLLAVLGAALFRELPSWRQLAGLLVCLVGLLLIASG